jgi:hypothetical protein
MSKGWSALTRLFGAGRLLSSAFSADEWAAKMAGTTLAV